MKWDQYSIGEEHSYEVYWSRYCFPKYRYSSLRNSRLVHTAYGNFKTNSSKETQTKNGGFQKKFWIKSRKIRREDASAPWAPEAAKPGLSRRNHRGTGLYYHTSMGRPATHKRNPSSLDHSKVAVNIKCFHSLLRNHNACDCQYRKPSNLLRHHHHGKNARDDGRIGEPTKRKKRDVTHPTRHGFQGNNIYAFLQCRAGRSAI